MKNLILLVIFVAHVIGISAQDDRNVILFSGLIHHDSNYDGYISAMEDIGNIDPFKVGELDQILGIKNSALTANTRLINTVGMKTTDQQIDPQNFAIGSSAGGIIARSMEMQLNNSADSHVQIGGIISMGGPHQGAQAINSRINGVGAEFSAETFHTLIDGVRDPLRVLPFGGALELSLYKKSFSNTVADVTIPFFSNLIVERLLPPKLSAEDQRIGSPVLAEINNYVTNKPIVAIQGVENAPLMFRTVRHGLIKPVKADHLDYDDKGDKWLKRSRGLFKATKVVINFRQVLAWMNPFLWPRIGKLNRANNSLKKVLAWYENHEAAWGILIGSTGSQTVMEELDDVFMCFDEQLLLQGELEDLIMNGGSAEDIGFAMQAIQDLATDPDCFGTESVAVVEHFINKPNDGSIPVDNMIYDGPTALNLTAEEAGNGAGHGESMNHPAVWAHLQSLFTGDLTDYNLDPQQELEFSFFKIN